MHAHAELHGVLLVPELDVPGHTHSWAPYAADCPHRTLHNKGAWGAPLNFDHPKLFHMLKSVLSEVRFTLLSTGIATPRRYPALPRDEYVGSLAW